MQAQAMKAERAMQAGISPERISITSQEVPKDLPGLIEKGVLFNACSLHQLNEYGRQFPGSHVGVRINPGLGLATLTVQT